MLIGVEISEGKSQKLFTSSLTINLWVSSSTAGVAALVLEFATRISTTILFEEPTRFVARRGTKGLLWTKTRATLKLRW